MYNYMSLISAKFHDESETTVGLSIFVCVMASPFPITILVLLLLLLVPMTICGEFNSKSVGEPCMTPGDRLGESPSTFGLMFPVWTSYWYCIDGE